MLAPLCRAEPGKFTSPDRLSKLHAALETLQCSRVNPRRPRTENDHSWMASGPQNEKHCMKTPETRQKPASGAVESEKQISATCPKKHVKNCYFPTPRPPPHSNARISKQSLSLLQKKWKRQKAETWHG